VFGELLHRHLVLDLVVDQAELCGDVRLEAFAGDKQRAGPARANGVDDVGRNGRRDDTEFYLREREYRAALGDGDVAGSGEAAAWMRNPPDAGNE
jgi:hypothetical protein